MADHQSINRIILVGYIASEINYKEQKGKMRAFFHFATNEVFRTRSGKTTKRVEFNPVVAWGYNAKIINDYAKKGTFMGIEGKLRTSKNREGPQSTEVNIERIIFMPRREESEKEEKNDPF